MAHYAFLDENNIVTEVIVGIDENQLIDGLDPETWYGNFRGQTCKRTSYNTIGRQHKNNGTPFRGNYAGIGFIYDPEKDVFYNQKPKNNPSFILNESTLSWEPPIPKPEKAENTRWEWDEETISWKGIPETDIEQYAFHNILVEAQWK